jgi:hypothetical protein
MKEEDQSPNLFSSGLSVLKEELLFPAPRVFLMVGLCSKTPAPRLAFAEQQSLLGPNDRRVRLSDCSFEMPLMLYCQLPARSSFTLVTIGA